MLKISLYSPTKQDIYLKDVILALSWRARKLNVCKKYQLHSIHMYKFNPFTSELFMQSHNYHRIIFILDDSQTTHFLLVKQRLITGLFLQQTDNSFAKKGPPKTLVTGLFLFLAWMETTDYDLDDSSLSIGGINLLPNSYNTCMFIYNTCMFITGLYTPSTRVEDAEIAITYWRVCCPVAARNHHSMSGQREDGYVSVSS